MQTVRHPRLGRALALLCTIPALGVGPLAIADATPTAAERSAQGELLQRINAVRAEYGRHALARSRVLARPARVHGEFVAATGLVQHQGEDGRPFYTRLYKAGYPRSRAVGEDIGLVSGCDAAAANEVVDMWLQSPPHRRVLLSRSFVRVGLGVVSDRECRNTGYIADFGG